MTDIDLGTAILLLAIGVAVGAAIAGSVLTLRFRRAAQALRADARKRSRSTLAGQFLEHLAPFLPGFRYDPTEARFVGDPIDYVVFDGIRRGEVEAVVFLEIKTGQSQLNGEERKLRDAIRAGRVRWEEIRLATPATSPSDSPPRGRPLVPPGRS